MNEFSKPNPGGEPVYLQIIKQFKLLLLHGRLKDGDDIPSRRVLAVQMGVNPMTVQKAFAELESNGFIHTPPNAKSVVRVDEPMLARLRGELLEERAAALVDTAKGAGMGYEELMKIMDTTWKRGGGNG
jgi:GntR family transcriptional regulator